MTRFHPEMEIRLTQIFSAAAIARSEADQRQVRRELARYARAARAQGLTALAGEADQLRWQLIAERHAKRGQAGA